MTRRTAATLAWSLFGWYVLMTAITLALVAASSATSAQLFVVMASGFAVVGALVAAREPGNPVGWLLLAAAISVGLQELAVAYLSDTTRPGAVAAAWLAIQLGWLYAGLVLLPLVFPTGRLLSPRWRVAVYSGVGGFVLNTLGGVLHPGLLDIDESLEPVQNPLGIGGPVTDVAYVLGNVLLAVGLVLAAASLGLRLRRSRGRERQQLKLFVYVGALAVTLLLLGMPAVFSGQNGPQWVVVIGTISWFTTIGLLLLGLPIAIGVAILRHKLYDIDLVINRTLVYGALTILLAASYLGMVLLFQLVLNPITSESDLAVAASTLAVAALFRPLRTRVQRVVDQRFFRQRYDAAGTLAGFSLRLRDELDLETLGIDLRRVVHETVQPAHVSLWLHEARS